MSYEKGGGLEEGGLNIRPGRRPADFFFTRLDCTGVAQTHFGRIATLLDRVIMQARAPFWTFPIFLGFCVFFRRRFGLRWRGPNTHLKEHCIDLLYFGFAFFRLSARVGKIHEKHSFYRSDFPEWRSRLHNNTIRVVPGCFLAPFWGAFGTPLGALGLPLAPLWLAFGPPWHLWELWRRTWVLNLMVLATPTCSRVLF